MDSRKLISACSERPILTALADPSQPDGIQRQRAQVNQDKTTTTDHAHPINTNGLTAPHPQAPVRHQAPSEASPRTAESVGSVGCRIVGAAAADVGGAVVAVVTNVNELLDSHVVLDVGCLDRLYLNAYVPNLQVGAQVAMFMHSHLGKKIASPAIMEQIGNRFRRDVESFAKRQQIPIVRFAKGDRQVDVMQPYLDAATGPGVVAVGTSQEFQPVFTGTRATSSSGVPFFRFAKADRRVSVFYFYIVDAEFGAGFIKICTYFPYPAKVWVNGHEWAKRQATRAGVGYTSLANGFATCDDPTRLQEICDQLGPAQIEAFFDRWMSHIPTPLTTTDRAGGYWWEMSMRQIEMSRTIVFDAPRRARGFFEAVIADNLNIGRPDEIKLIFNRQIRRNTVSEFATKVVTRGTEVTINAFYKHSRIKQYLKEGRALRIETVVNSPTDLGVQRRLVNLPELIDKARAVNRRLLECERAGQGCAIETSLWERISQPSQQEGQRTGALRFGDPRAMALTGALCVALLSVVGFTNKTLRGLVSQLLDKPYTRNQMTYDLRRLRLLGLIRRLPKSNTYILTSDGQRAVITYTKLGDRLLPQLLASHAPPAPPPLRAALHQIDRHIDNYLDRARLKPAA